jgi:nicotinamidase-related amidase
MDNKDKALILVDIQKAFDDKKWGERNNLNAEENTSKILQLWRKKGFTVIIIKHKSDNPRSVFHSDNEGYAIKDIVKPIDGEVMITK